MMMNGVQEAARLASMKDQGNHDDDGRFCCEDHQDEPAEEMVRCFDDLRDFGHRDPIVLQVIRDLCTKYNVNEPSYVVEAQAIIEDRILSTPRGNQLTDQLFETKKACMTHKTKHETKLAGFSDLAFERILLQRNTADTLARASGAVGSLAASTTFLREDVF